MSCAVPGAQVVHAVHEPEFGFTLNVPASHGVHVRSRVVVPAAEANVPAAHSDHGRHAVAGSLSSSNALEQVVAAASPPAQYCPALQRWHPLAEGAEPGSHELAPSEPTTSTPASVDSPSDTASFVTAASLAASLAPVIPPQPIAAETATYPSIQILFFIVSSKEPCTSDKRAVFLDAPDPCTTVSPGRARTGCESLAPK